jgi:two-component system, cell cycle response regulator
MSPNPVQGEFYDSNKTQIFTIEGVNSSFSDGQDVQDLLESVVYFMSRNFKAYSSLGFIYDPMRQIFILNSFQSKSLNVIKKGEIPLGKGVVGRIGTEKRSFMSGNISNYNLELNYYSKVEQINSILAVPIISDKSELLGTLILDSTDKNAFKDQEKDNLKRFSGLAAALITNARVRIYQEKAARIFQTFYQASHQFTTALNINDVFEVLFNVVPALTDCTRMIALLYKEETGKLLVNKVYGSDSDICGGFEFPINSGLYSFAFQKRRTVNIGDYQLYIQKYYRFIPDEPEDLSLRSLIIFPIVDDENRCRGLFSIENANPDQFKGEMEQTLSALLENASVAFIRALLYQKMERLATTDGLTGLYNHRNFQDLLAKELERSRRYKRPLSLLILDIDHFKTFNDTYGHPVGDLVLKEIALCIRKSIRVNDVPARYGGEEFVVIVPEESQPGALTVAERIRTTIEKHTIVSLGRQLKVTVSIGCATYPDHASTQQALIDIADKALYFSKENGRNRVTFFQPGMGDNKV